MAKAKRKNLKDEHLNSEISNKSNEIKGELVETVFDRELLESEFSKLKTEVSILTEKLNLLKSKFAKQLEDNKVLVSRNEELSNKVTSLQKTNDDLVSYKQNLEATAKSQYEELCSKNNLLVSRESDINKLSDVNRRNSSKIVELEKDILSKDKTISNLQSVVKELSATPKCSGDKCGSLIDANNEVISLKQQLNSQKSDMIKLNEEIISLNRQLLDQGQELVSEKHLCSELEQKLMYLKTFKGRVKNLFGF